MQPLQKTICAAHIEGKQWKQKLYSLLRNYRATPHSSTGVSPAELMFQRKINIRLPRIEDKPHKSPTQVRAKYELSKEKMKANADGKTRSQQQSFTPGLTVLVQQKKKGKLSPPFNPQLYTVTKLNGSMVKASHNCHEITRYSSFYKIIPKPHSEPPRNLRSPPDDDEEAPTTECNQQTNPQPQVHPYYLRSWSKVQQST